jgi:hypothetical protein
MASRHPYATAAYADALSFTGRAIDLPEWGGFAFARPIEGGGEDAVGPYPRAPLPPDADLEGGLERLHAEGLVSAVLVPDPLQSPDPSRLASAFELSRPFKTHLLIDRTRGFDPTKHHRDEIRRGLRRCTVQAVSLAVELETWRSLYDGLVARHDIVGAANFPDAYFATLAGMETFTAFAARVDGEIAGMALWFEHAGIAVSHLNAANSVGYANGVNYALYSAAIEHFADAAVIDLGGGAGRRDAPEDGLFQFKRGFANSEVMAMICGSVLDASEYARLSAGRAASFFPAYRG